MVLALAKDLYGTNWKRMVLELNASDDRGIAVVRNEIKSFAETMQLGSSKGFKLLILDEMDNMTNVAQMALRRIIEKYMTNVRFCLICNYVNKVIPAIQSRCTRFKFKPLPLEYISNKLQEVITTEQISISPEALHSLSNNCAGDLRTAMNVLQSAKLFKNANSVTEDDI